MSEEGVEEQELTQTNSEQVNEVTVKPRLESPLGSRSKKSDTGLASEAGEAEHHPKKSALPSWLTRRT